MIDKLEKKSDIFKNTAPQNFYILFFIIVFIFFSRYIWNIYYPARITSDCQSYWTLALNIANYGSYKQGGLYEIFWPPLWPYFLAMVIDLRLNLFSPPFILFILQVLNAWVIWELARTISPKISVAIITLIIYIVYPSYLLLSNVYLTEHLFTLLFNLFLLIVFRLIINEGGKKNGLQTDSNENDNAKKAAKKFITKTEIKQILLGIIAGACLGLATLTRGITYPIIVILFILLFINAKKSRMFKIPINFWLVAIVIAIVPVLFWTYRNYIVTKHFIIVSSNSAENLWLGNNDAIIPIWLPSYSPYRETFDGLNAVETYVKQNKEAINFIIMHPVLTVFRWVIKFRFFFDVNIYDLGFQDIFVEKSGHLMYNFWNSLNQIICIITYIGIIIFFATGFLVKKCLDEICNCYLLKIIMMVIVFWIFLHLISWGSPRFRYPLEHFLWIIAIIGYIRLFQVREIIKAEEK